MPSSCYSSISDDNTFTPSEVRGWPTHPRSLRLSLPGRLVHSAPDFLVFFIPVGFITLGICMLQLSGQTESDWSRRVVEVITVAPTIWPIFFAAVVGNTLQSLALYQAERGTKLGVIEQLVGSHTFLSTITTFFKLRSFDLRGIALLCLWAFNPIGGQSSLRSVALRTTTGKTNVTLQYHPPSLLAAVESTTLISSPGTNNSEWDVMVRTLYRSALNTLDAGIQYSNGSSKGFQLAASRLGTIDAALKVSRTDAWGNVRIPKLEALRNFNPKRPQDWVEVPFQTEVIPYVSLIGVPVHGFPSNGSGNISFVIPTHYHSFKCANWTGPNYNYTDWMQENYHKLQTHYNKTLDLPPYSQAWETLFSNVFTTNGFTMDTTTALVQERENLYPSDNSSQIPAREIIFGTSSESFTSCQVSMSYIDAQISCTEAGVGGSMSCVTSAVRQRPPPISANWTYFDMPQLSSIAIDLLNVLEVQIPGSLGPTTLFIYDPPAVMHNNVSAEEVDYPLYKLPIEVFQDRLGLVYNTYWRATQSPATVMSRLSGYGMFGPDGTNWIGNVTAEWTYLNPSQYVLSIPWMLLYFTATAIVTLCATFTTILHFITTAPEILGYISTLTRDTPYMTLPPYGSALGGDERARLLKDTWVRIQDVQIDEDVGKIALSSDKSLSEGRLLKHRLYK